MLASHKGEIPYVVYLLPFLAGIITAVNTNATGWQNITGIIFSLLLAAFIIFNLFYRQFNLHRKQWVGGMLLHGLLFFAGVFCTLRYDQRSTPDYFTKAKADALLIKVNNEPQLKGRYLRFTAAVMINNCQGKMRQSVGNLSLILPVDSTKAAAIAYGDELIIPANYNPIEPPYNPGEFNYRQYLAHQNIYQQAFLNPRQLIRLHKNDGNCLIGFALSTRQHFVNSFNTFLPDTEAVAVASTLILGYKASLSNEVLQAYANTGTIHVLSVSGAHVAIIFYLISFMLGFLDKHRYGRLINLMLSITLIWTYALLTGLSPAVCRAAVMISLIIVGKKGFRYINTLNILAASAFLLLLIDPYLVTDVGFQLSYVAVAGLIVFQPIIYSWLTINNKWLDKLCALCAASIAAQVITFPLSVYYFHQFPVYFLFSNMFVLLPAALMIYVGVVFLVSAQLGLTILAKPLAYLLNAIIMVTDRGLQYIEHLPLATINKIWISPFEAVLLFAIVILFIATSYYKKPVLLRAGLIALLVFSISTGFAKIRAIKSKSVIFFNVKQHAAFLFRQGTAAALVTDLPDTDDVFKYSIQPCLDSSKVSRLTIARLNQDVCTGFFNKKTRLMHFDNKNYLLLDKDFKFDGTRVNCNYLYLNGNLHANSHQFNQLAAFSLLTSNATNADKLLLQTLDTLKKSKKIYMLRRNKALVIESDE